MTGQRLFLASLVAAWASMVIGCGGPNREEIKKKLDRADVLWDSSKKTDAVMEYRLVYQDSLSDEKEKILPRLVEAEIKAGNTDEAKKWIKRGLDDKLNVEYSDLTAKELYAAIQKEREKAAAEQERKNREAAAEAKRRRQEDQRRSREAEAEAERKRQEEQHLAYSKAQATFHNAQAALSQAEARAKAHPASKRPAFTLQGVRLVKDFRSRGDFVLVYAKSGGRPIYAVSEGTKADVLDVPGKLCRVVFTSGPHEGEKGYVWTDSLPSETEAAVRKYRQELADFLESEPSNHRYEAEVSAAQRKIEDAETVLRKYRLPDEEKFRRTAALQPWASGLQQIPATVIDKGVLRNIPYKSFRAGDYEVNIYGDPDNPSGLEVGVYKNLIQSQRAKNECKEFMAAVLNDPADRAVLKSLKLTQDIQIRDGLTFEVTPETAEDAYGGWWITVYDSSALDRSRASQQELASITVPKPSITVSEPATPVPVPAITIPQRPPQMARVSLPSWSPQQHTLARPGGRTVYVHGYYRKNGTYVHSYMRSPPGSGSHRRR